MSQSDLIDAPPFFQANPQDVQSWLSVGGQYIAGGVVSINRKAEPQLVFREASGAYLVDHDGRRYIDYHAAFAPHILGHNHPAINAAVMQAMQRNWSLFGSGPTFWEAELARRVCSAVPGLESIQVTNTGSEATAHAIRLSRAWTGRDHILLTMGGYNGWHNDVSRAVMPSLDQAGPRVSPGEYSFIPASAGIPDSTQRQIHVVNFNDLASAEYVLKRYPIACVLTEPVLQNIGVVPPQPGYLQGLAELCTHYGALLVFDEVKTGFRCALGGYQSLAGVRPDLSTFGKAIANGYPLGIIGGRSEIMDLFCAADPTRRVLIAGTYNAHPLTTAAAIATLDLLANPETFAELERKGAALEAELNGVLAASGRPTVVSRLGSAFCIYFMDHIPVDWHDVLLHHDFGFDLQFRRALINAGVYFFPLPCKQCSISAAHTNEDLRFTVNAVANALQSLK